MIQNFRCADTGSLFYGKRVARFANIETVALEFLRIPPANHLEALVGDRKGQHSIRINQQWRVCFEWLEGHVYRVEIVDYH